MKGTESRSWTNWRVAELEKYPLRAVLFFEDEPPEDLLNSGLYVGFTDFKDVMRDMGTTPEPLANLYHTLILYFTQNDPRMHAQAEGHLRYNPANRASWNQEAWTYKYYLRTELLSEYSSARVDRDHKIAGIGLKSRKIMRAVLGSDDIFEG